MPNQYYCDGDMFAATMETMLEDIVSGVDKATMPVVRKTCKLATKLVKKNATDHGWEDYPSGFEYTTSRRRLESIGEVGNADKPGLVHLLEKGHAKMGGGRVRGYEHVAPAAEIAFEYFAEELDREVGKAL